MITSRFPALTVEHVGSTSVPGCSGKGVIDLMVVYPPGLLKDTKTLGVKEKGVEKKAIQALQLA
jgi:GrpB-like predicted nucleotidyltransferase (UPF0157 family)